MNGPSSDELRGQRQKILRGLSLLHSLNLAVILLVAGLAAVAILLGVQARNDAEKIWATSVTQARAARFGGEIGWKNDSLAIIGAASQVRPSLALRNEAISSLAALDLEAASPWIDDSANHEMVAFNPELTAVAIGDWEGRVQILDVQSKRTLKTFQGPRFIERLRFDPTGRHLAARFNGGHLRVWDVATDSLVISNQVSWDEETPTGIEFTGGSVVLAASGGELEFHQLATGEKSSFKMSRPFFLFATSTTAQRVVLCRDRTVEVWNRETERLEREWTFPAAIASLAISSDGLQVAAGAVDNKVYLWQLARGEIKTLTGHHGTVFHVRFNTKGTRLASSAFGGTTRLWEVASGMPLMGADSLFIDEFSQDDEHVACSRTKAGFGVFRIADSGILRNIALPSEADPSIHHLAFLDERLLLASQSEGAEIINLIAGTSSTLTRSQRTRSALFHHGMEALMTASAESLQIWPLLKKGADASGTPAVGAPTVIELKQGTANESLQLSSDGTELLARIGLRGAVLMDMGTRAVRAVFNVPNIGGVALSPDKQWIATGTFHGAGTKVWDRTGKLVRDLGGRDASVAFSADGRWLATVSAQACEFYEGPEWKLKHRIPLESASGLPGAAAFSPDGRTFAFTRQRRMVELVQPGTWLELGSLAAPYSQQINHLTFSPGGNLLAAGTSDGVVQTWDVQNLRGHLRAINLDWETSRGLATTPAIDRITWVGGIATATLLAVLAFGALGWARHRQFLGAYSRVEQMIDTRDRELAETLTELHQSQKMRALGTLAAGIAHDFNNLLSVIRLSNQLTAEQTRDNADVQENATLISRAVEQGRQVVRSMLGYSRQAGAREDYSAGEVVEQTIALLRKQFLQGIQLRFDAEGGLPLVHGTRNRLEQILLNLIINAAEAMKGSGELRVSLRNAGPERRTFALRPKEVGSYIELTIEDSGPGISEDVQPQIFEPFFTTKTVGNDRGTGLGLSMVYAIAQEEGIGIIVESYPGRGSAFRLYLPCAGKSGVHPTERLATLTA